MHKEKLADLAVTAMTMGQPMFEGTSSIGLEEAFDVADLVHERVEKPMKGLAGYKIAWNTSELMEKFGLEHPGMGRVYKRQLRGAGEAVALADFHEMMIEVEIVAFIGKTLSPGEAHTAASMREAISHFVVGFELLNRYPGSETATAAGIIAHNVFNAGAVLGQIELPPEELDTSAITTRLTQDGSTVFEDVGKAPQDPFEAAAFIANHFTKRGVTFHPGELILCGSHIPLYPVTDAGVFSVSMSALGEVSFKAV